MHDALRQRLLRRIESLPDEQIYQVLDYIEFLESKYSTAGPVEASGLQRFAEGLEDKLRRKAVSPNTIREAFQLISAADKVLSGVSSAGKQILSDLNSVLEPGTDEPDDAPPAGREARDTPATERRPPDTFTPYRERRRREQAEAATPPSSPGGSGTGEAGDDGLAPVDGPGSPPRTGGDGGPPLDGSAPEGADGAPDGGEPTP